MDFLQRYMDYTEDTESPRIYHRWCAIAACAAALGRSIYFRHGSARDYPNLYCMLLGDPAARKSTAIKLSRKLLSSSGYHTFASDKSSQEKFLTDLATDNADDIELPNVGAKGVSRRKDYDSITSSNLWGTGDESVPKEVFIVADEFNQFVGSGNHEFFTTLGNLWDWDDPNLPFKMRFKSGSVSIYQPTISILGGNTQENFARAFPPELIGQGFLSRVILIHGARSSRRIAFPRIPSDTETDLLTRHLAAIRSFAKTELECNLNSAARELLEVLYSDWSDLTDVRFLGYSNRRFTHLRKLCLILAGMKQTTTITEQIVIEANTYLSAAEMLMPQALGEFGKSKNSDVANNIIKFLEGATEPVSFPILFKQFQKDVGDSLAMGKLMESLLHADKVMLVKGMGNKSGYLAKKEVRRSAKHVDWSLLTEEERP